MTGRQCELLKNLSGAGWVTTNQLAALMGCEPQAVSNVIRHLADAGTVEKRKAGQRGATPLLEYRYQGVNRLSLILSRRWDKNLFDNGGDRVH
ncbi:MarR family transcriptional regulator [Ferrimonas balearica]|uniref:MarR family transcriptional regulator n=1 Tax=Ferrimonas balearica TaxID=44012 RepID=UPI001C96EB14|nr:helix-turn-helix domain-containing protein [Ferrimonas balearica]MBY6104871.1 MarR family transcriptional regulator [Ferrimonas balearica]